ncbi:TsoY family (seleno)protein [Pseudomonas sp. ABY48]|uniref:TsoY family (seleno)protein n=1 Tax=Pseudomonas sp. ABY48 TaxID=3402865 RepID=UPI003B432735
MFQRTSDIPYHPSYWLSALGAGGLSISFFMYLMWMVPHAGSPMPTWDYLLAAWLDADTSPPMSAILLIAGIGVLTMAILHFLLLAWNIREYRAAASQEALAALRQSPAEVQLMTVPLTLAMTVNVCFVLGALFVPGLWSVVEYLFPLALLAFAAIAWGALQIYGRYLSRMLVSGGYRSEEHNHLSSLLAVFTFAMLSVGFAAPAAMSHVKLVSTLAATLSILFLVLSLVVGLIVLITGISAMMTHGLQPEATPSIWMLVPILTLLGIEWLRLQHGLSRHFSGGASSGTIFVMLTGVFTLQLGVMLVGYRVMQLNGYLRAHLSGLALSPVSFGLICPGVAIFVMGMFWWHLVWVNGGLVEQFGVVYWTGILTLAAIQLVTLGALLRLTWSLLLHREVHIAGIDG